MSPEAYLDVIRRMIEHEDSLRDQRLSWLLALNGFLFAGLGFAWSDTHAASLVVVFAIVGVLAAVTSAFALQGSELAIHGLAQLAESVDANSEAPLPPVIALRSSVRLRVNRDDRRHRRIRWLYPWKLLPWALALTWLAVPVVRLAVD